MTTQKGEYGENEFFDMEASIVKLQKLGEELKKSISQLPDSEIKECLWLKATKEIKLNTIYNFYYLQDLISGMMDVVVQWSLEGKTLTLLAEISIEAKRVIDYMESDNPELGK